MRTDRLNNEMRKVKVSVNYLKNAEGSVLIEMGDTKVICSAMVEEKVPFFLKGKGQGWLTCEYSMLPASTLTRKTRDSAKGKVDGRSTEIQRLIGRSLRSVIDFEKLGERTIWIDCDVIQADGGTRTASITGAFLALSIAVKNMLLDKTIEENPIISSVAAISVGVVDGEVLLDLCYLEDSNAEVDMNIVMDSNLKIIEIQGTGETKSFSRTDLNTMIDYGEIAMKKLLEIQSETLNSLEEEA